MSSNPRGTKRSADSAPEGGHKFKSSKPAFNKGGDKPSFNKGGKPSFNKGGKPAFNNYKGKAPAHHQGGNKPFGKKPFTPKEDAEPPVARRKRPVTQGGGEDDAMSVDEDEGDDMGGDDMDVDGGDEQGVGGDMEKRPKMSKEERAALHAANPHRTSLLPSHALLTNTLLPLWETARQTEMPKEERKKAIAELYEAVKGHALEISRGHKGGRILQTVSYKVTGLPCYFRS